VVLVNYVRRTQAGKVLNGVIRGEARDLRGVHLPPPPPPPPPPSRSNETRQVFSRSMLFARFPAS